MAEAKNTEEKKLFKDWFDRDAAAQIANQIAGVKSDFNEARFIQIATDNLQSLEMLGRVEQFARAMRECLPESMPEALDVLVKALPEALPDAEEVTNGFLMWPMGQFIADYATDYLDEAFDAMIELTQRLTSEFAVRPFVERYPDEVFARLTKLTSHPNVHVRRWCSEGVRTRLPWGKKLHFLIKDPSPIWPILEALKDDPELYVRRSVANNINDIAKDHPEMVVKRCKAWSQDSNELRDYVVRHGLRSLVKDGHPGALEILGFAPPQDMDCALQVEPAEISVGQSVQMSATLSNCSAKNQKLVVDYKLHYVRNAGKTNAKVFKWSNLNLDAKSEITLNKQHPMKVTTVRKLYPGLHKVELQVNGVVVAESEFNLTS